jgi:hypothetical protein
MLDKTKVDAEAVTGSKGAHRSKSPLSEQRLQNKKRRVIQFQNYRFYKNNNGNKIFEIKHLLSFVSVILLLLRQIRNQS